MFQPVNVFNFCSQQKQNPYKERAFASRAAPNRGQRQEVPRRRRQVNREERDGETAAAAKASKRQFRPERQQSTLDRQEAPR